MSQEIINVTNDPTTAETFQYSGKKEISFRHVLYQEYLIVQPVGDLMNNQKEFHQYLENLLNENPIVKSIAIDCVQVLFLDSNATWNFFILWKRLQEKNVELVLFQVRQKVYRIFTFNEFHKTIPIFDTKHDFLRHHRKRLKELEHV